MSAHVTSLKPKLSMPCWLENHGAAIHTPERKAAWHADCPNSLACSCPAHYRATPAEVGHR